MKILNFCKQKIGNRFTNLLILELLLIFLIVICPICTWSDLNKSLEGSKHILDLFMFVFTVIACSFTWKAYENTQEQL